MHFIVERIYKMTNDNIQYVIVYNDSGNYLNIYDNETEDLSKANFFDTLIEAHRYLNDIDVAYLFHIQPVKLLYQLIDINL
jgi:hypothetical protein